MSWTRLGPSPSGLDLLPGKGVESRINLIIVLLETEPPLSRGPLAKNHQCPGSIPKVKGLQEASVILTHGVSVISI